MSKNLFRDEMILFYVPVEKDRYLSPPLYYTCCLTVWNIIDIIDMHAVAEIIEEVVK